MSIDANDKHKIAFTCKSPKFSVNLNFFLLLQISLNKSCFALQKMLSKVNLFTREILVYFCGKLLKQEFKCKKCGKHWELENQCMNSAGPEISANKGQSLFRG